MGLFRSPKALLIPLFTLLIYLGTVFEFAIPGTSLMQTGQTIAVLCAGALLGPLSGMLAVLLYIVLGVLGLPVFSEGAAGFAVLQGASGGYLLGFVLAAGLLGLLRRSSKHRQFTVCALAMLAGHALILVCGWAWMSRQMGMLAAYENGIAPFYLGALVKSLLGAALVQLVVLLKRAA